VCIGCDLRAFLPKKEHEDDRPKSTKSSLEMTQEEKDQLDEDWPKMSEEEKRKQIKRDFYGYKGE